MKKYTIVGLAVVLGVIGTATVVVWAADEETVTIDQVPSAVRETILKEAKGGTIKEIERETEDGKVVYEAEVIINGKEFDIEVSADGTLLGKEGSGEEKEQEREVTEAEVPAPALAALKKLAAGAKITEFAEEIEHGHTFYEGSWKGPSGSNVDVLVTAAGDLVEIEERVSADQVPSAVLGAARRAAGEDARLGFEKKTMILYEVKFRKGDRRHELLLTPDGRRIEEEIERGHGEDDDD